MQLYELKEIEFQLLLIEDKRFDMDFNDYLKLEDFLDKIGKITDNYVKYMENYEKNLQEMDINEKKTILSSINQTLLQTEIEISLLDVKEFIEKYKVNLN